MELERWIETFADFPLDEAEAEVRKLELEDKELERRRTEIAKRTAVLRAIIGSRRALDSVGRHQRVLFEIVTDPSEIPPPRNNTSAAILEVMATDPARVWTVLDILGALSEADKLPNSKDPRRALDATLHRLAIKTGDIVRVKRGGYVLTPHLSTQTGDDPEASTQNGDPPTTGVQSS